MKIDIKNWCTDGDVVDMNYRNGWTVWNTFTTDMYHEYQFRYKYSVQPAISIKLWRNPNENGKYPLYAINLKTSKKLTIPLPKDSIKDKGWIIYHINEIIKELEK